MFGEKKHQECKFIETKPCLKNGYTCRYVHVEPGWMQYLDLVPNIFRRLPSIKFHYVLGSVNSLKIAI